MIPTYRSAPLRRSRGRCGANMVVTGQPLAGRCFVNRCTDATEAARCDEEIVALGGEVYSGRDAWERDAWELARLQQECSKGARERGTVVTPTWLAYQSLDPRSWLPPAASPLFRPLSSEAGIPALRKVPVALAGFRGAERHFARLLIDATGASYTESFQPGRTKYLVCADDSARDRVRARRKALAAGMLNRAGTGIRVELVRLSWLSECLWHWKKADEAGHRVEAVGTEDLKPRSAFAAPLQSSASAEGNEEEQRRRRRREDAGGAAERGASHESEGKRARLGAAPAAAAAPTAAASCGSVAAVPSVSSLLEARGSGAERGAVPTTALLTQLVSAVMQEQVDLIGFEKAKANMTLKTIRAVLEGHLAVSLLDMKADIKEAVTAFINGPTPTGRAPPPQPQSRDQAASAPGSSAATSGTAAKTTSSLAVPTAAAAQGTAENGAKAAKRSKTAKAAKANAAACPVVGAASSPAPAAAALLNPGKGLVGKTIELYWPLDLAWYVARVDAYEGASGQHSVTYLQDGHTEKLTLREEKWRLFEGDAASLPPLSPLPARPALQAQNGARRAPTAATKVHGPLSNPPPVLRADSSDDEEPRPDIAAAARRGSPAAAGGGGDGKARGVGAGGARAGAPADAERGKAAEVDSSDEENAHLTAAQVAAKKANKRRRRGAPHEWNDSRARRFYTDATGSFAFTDGTIVAYQPAEGKHRALWTMLDDDGEMESGYESDVREWLDAFQRDLSVEGHVAELERREAETAALLERMRAECEVFVAKENDRPSQIARDR